MKALRSIATAAVIGSAALVTPAAVEARTSYCYENNAGADVCVLAVVRHKTNYNKRWVKSSVNGNVSVDEVYCNPNHRSNYKRNLFGIACFEFSF